MSLNIFLLLTCKVCQSLNGALINGVIMDLYRILIADLISAGRMFNVTTVSYYSYNQAWITTSSTDHMVVRIKACRDPHILLSETVGMGNNSYEVAFGIIDNTRSVIREGPYGANIVNVETPGIMSCYEFRLTGCNSYLNNNLFFILFVYY